MKVVECQEDEAAANCKPTPFKFIILSEGARIIFSLYVNFHISFSSLHDCFHQRKQSCSKKIKNKSAMFSLKRVGVEIVC